MQKLDTENINNRKITNRNISNMGYIRMCGLQNAKNQIVKILVIERLQNRNINNMEYIRIWIMEYRRLDTENVSNINKINRNAGYEIDKTLDTENITENRNKN